MILLPYLWTLYWNCKNVVLWSQWWSEKLPVCHLLIWQNSLKYLLQNLNILLINYSKQSVLLQNRKMELRFSMMIFSNLLLVKIFQVLRSLIFLIFNMTSLSANICTETTSTNVYRRCASLFSQCFMGKVLWGEASISINICWFVWSIYKRSEIGLWLFQVAWCKVTWIYNSKGIAPYCKRAHSKYEETHQKTKKIESNKENKRKRKMKEDIKQQKLSLEQSIKSTQADFNNYLTLAEEKKRYFVFGKTLHFSKNCSNSARLC